MTPHRYPDDELPKGISADETGYRCYVRRNGKLKEKRFKFGTALSKMTGWRESMGGELKRHAAKPQIVRGTLEADVLRWLDSDVRKAMSGYGAHRSNFSAWMKATEKDTGKPYAGLSRSKITRDHVLHARDQWTAQGVAPKTINNRAQSLGQLYHDLDGGLKAETPVDTVAKLEPTQHTPQFVTPRIIIDVARVLAPRPLDQARYMVLVSTGMRPATFKRSVRSDVDLKARGWLLRKTKGGNPVPLYLNADQLAAIKRYIEVGGFEHPSHSKFDVSDYGRLLYDSGWPRHVKPYSAKHTIGITLARAGVDWREIAEYFGHTDHKTSKIYTGIVFSKLRPASVALAKRQLGFGGLATDGRKIRPARRVKDGALKTRLARKLAGKVGNVKKTA